MSVSSFLVSNDISPKYYRDIAISFFWVVVESCIHLMNNLYKNLWIQLSMKSKGNEFFCQTDFRWLISTRIYK